MDIAGVGDDGEDSTKCIVGSICLNDQGLIGLPVCEDQSRGEGSLQGIEGFLNFICKIPLSPLTGQAGQQNNNLRVIRNETTVEIGKA